MNESTDIISPKFPVYDCDFNFNSFSDGPLPLILDLYLYKNMSDDDFDAFFLNHKVIDSNGRGYVITGRKQFPKWKKLIPGSKKAMLEFKYVGLYSLAEVKENIIEHIKKNITLEKIKDRWIEKIKMAVSINELFFGSE